VFLGRLGVVLLALGAGWAAVATAEGPHKRQLFIALDAVPFWVVADVTNPELGEQALFQGFKGPVPLISTFPSSTSVAMVGILEPFDVAKSPGYEARFFDWQRRKVRGGGAVSYFKIEFAWREFFDWSRRSPAGSAVEAVRPVRSGIKRLRKALKDFVRSERHEFFIYLAATDTAAHIQSPEALKELFAALDEMLVEIREQQPERPFEVIIFSDHGMAGGEPLQNTWGKVKRSLNEAGFRIVRRPHKPQDLALTPFGLVSNFEAYTSDEATAEVAALLARVEGVDLCVYRLDEGWRIEGHDGSATLQRRLDDSGLWWLYQTHHGDPLGFSPLLQAFQERGAAPRGWVPDAEWFEATADTQYPDAFYRIPAAFDLVQNPASAVCSLAPGFMYGARRTDLMARVGKGRLRWTHGALEREATLGFLLSDAEEWNPPRAVRFDQSLVPFWRPAASESPAESPVDP
jgi:hypothetical protein